MNINNDITIERIRPYNYRSTIILDKDPSNNAKQLAIVNSFMFEEYGPYIRDELIYIYEHLINELKNELVIRPDELIDWL